MGGRELERKGRGGSDVSQKGSLRKGLLGDMGGEGQKGLELYSWLRGGSEVGSSLRGATGLWKEANKVLWLSAGGSH